MEFTSIIISIVALLVSAYFSYIPYRQKRNVLFQKLCIYEKVFQDLLKNWEWERDWLSKLSKDAFEKKNGKFSIVYNKDVFDLYPLTPENEDALASLGNFSEKDRINEEKKEIPFLMLRQLIHDLSIDSWPMSNGRINYEFIEVDLALNYFERNGTTEGKQAEYILGLIREAKRQLV